MAKLKKSNVHKPLPRVSNTKKQQDLIQGSINRFGRKSDVYGIFLIRQGLRVRSEQFVTLAHSFKEAQAFCRNTLTPKLCNENVKSSLRTINHKGELLLVNFSNNKLLIKTQDFVRKEEGRVNSNPLWYWNIALLTVLKHSNIIED